MSAGVMDRVQLQYRAFEIALAIMEELVEMDDVVRDDVKSLSEAKDAAGDCRPEGFAAEVVETECGSMTTHQAEEAVEIAGLIVDALLENGELKVLRKERADRETGVLDGEVA